MTDWQRDLDDARATIEELTRERDEARALAERWRRDAIEDVPSREVHRDIRALLGLSVGQSTIAAVRQLKEELRRAQDMYDKLHS